MTQFFIYGNMHIIPINYNIYILKSQIRKKTSLLEQIFQILVQESWSSMRSGGRQKYSVVLQWAGRTT